MQYWLLKSEPETYSWDTMRSEGTTLWDGVRNYQARNNMKNMKKGDMGFFYHSGKERAIVGIVKITKEYYPDPTDETGKFVVVDVTYDRDLKKPVTLAAIKAEPRLSELSLVRHSRLSVMPVPEEMWNIIVGMEGS